MMGEEAPFGKVRGMGLVKFSQIAGEVLSARRLDMGGFGESLGGFRRI
jgi:hypothetical protein